jgi:hypothetical protein
VDGPWFENQVGTLVHEGPSAEVRIDKTRPGDADEDGGEDGDARRLQRVFARDLVSGRSVR